jgi:mannosidase alpha-like ER degradation enhancer 2
MTRNKDTSSYDEQFKQLVHVSAEESEESTLAKPPTLFEENTESLPKDEEEFRSQEVAVVGGNPVSEAAVENLEGQTRVSAVSDLSTPTSVQGETASSTESILTDYCDTDIKDVVVEDEPRERGNPSYVRPEDDTNQETYKSEEEREICEMGKSKSCKTIATDTVNGSYHEVLEEDKKIHWLENQEEELPKCSAYGALDTGEAVSLFQSALAVSSATDGREFKKHELGIAATREISDSVIAEVDPNVTEMTDKDQGETIDKDVADKNEADSFEGDKTPDGTHDVVSIIKVNGKDSGLGQSLSAPLPILNEVIIEELSAPMTATSFALQPVEASIKEDIKPSSLDSNEGTTTSTYEAKTIDTHVTMNNSQCDQPQQVLLEEPEVVKFENSKTPTTCMQLVEYSSATEISPNVFHKEREDTSHKATRFTSESNQDNLTGTVGFASESTQKKVITDGDKASEEQCLLQTPTLGRDVAHADEETPLLLSAESINSSSYSSEEHIEVVKDTPITSIALIQAKDEAMEEYEKSPLLSPRGPSEGAFRAPNQSARNNRPLHTLMKVDRVGMWAPLKGQEPVADNHATVSSPRSKEKQKPKSSLFSICMCCTTATN